MELALVEVADFDALILNRGIRVDDGASVRIGLIIIHRAAEAEKVAGHDGFGDFASRLGAAGIVFVPADDILVAEALAGKLDGTFTTDELTDLSLRGVFRAIDSDVSAAQAQLIDDVAIKPYESRYKIYIINEAQKMTLQAQNALLKTIEEPPAYAVILLLADNPDSLLPTISSRCVILNLKPVSDNLVKSYLMERMHIPDYQAEVDASFAQGNIGKAERIATSEEYAEVMENSLRLVKYAQNMELYELVEAIKGMTADKDNIQDYLDIFSMWFRDVLLFKATREVDTLVFRQEINYIKERAQKSSYEGLERIIDAIQTAGVRLKANVNFELTMELLFLTIKEN